MFQRFFVPLDGSVRAEKAIPVAALLAHASGGTVIFARVLVPPAGADEYGANVLANETRLVRAEVAAEARTYLAEILDRYTQELEGIHHLVAEVTPGHVPSTLFALASQEHSDLIVGSATQATFRQSPLPVLALSEHGNTLFPEGGPLRILVPLDGSTCAACDAHGFLVTAKKADDETETAARQRVSKATLIDFSYVSTRSGAYALCIRYLCAGIGADTERWQLFVKDPLLREKRHRAILQALRDSLVSPDGAQVATMLPHLTSLSGAITVRTQMGRAPLYSALESDFATRLQAMADETCQVYPFETVDSFYTLMNAFITASVPALHPFWMTEAGE